MALVSYDSSDNSDLDDDQPSINTFTTADHDNKSAPLLADSSNPIYFKDTGISPNEGILPSNNLFKTLPRPTHNKITEEDDEILHKRENNIKKEKAKIAIPSLSEFKDVADTVIKKTYQGNNKKSGLLSMLPEPKFSGSSNKKPSKPLIPNIVERKATNLDLNNTHVKKSNTKKPIQANLNKRNPLLTADYSDSDEDDHENSFTGKDFFSIHSEQVMPEEIVNKLVKDQHDNIKTDGRVNRKPSSENYVHDVYQAETEQSYVNVVPDYPPQDCANAQHQDVEAFGTSTSSANELQLDDEAIRQLCGSRKRHRKEDIQVITVDQQQVLSDSREWLVKGLMDDTSKRVSSSKRRGNEPTSQQKRKHQITYLAHQAKANEAELQNQWSNNRMSKRQTQSKYGF